MRVFRALPAVCWALVEPAGPVGVEVQSAGIGDEGGGGWSVLYCGPLIVTDD